jgi:DNA-binding IclR family transcriptional regulator
MSGAIEDLSSDGKSRRVEADAADTEGFQPAGAGSLAPAVTRAAAILDLLARMGGQAAGARELARMLQAPKSSVMNVCVTLLETGLLRRTESGFALGPKLAELGGAYLATVNEVQAFYEACPLLAVASEETIQLARLDRLEMIYLAQHDGHHITYLASEIGRRMPAGCTATGKASLALLDDAELRARFAGSSLPRLTPHSHRTFGSLLSDIRRVRHRGYAVDDEESTEGIVCLGVAVPRRRPADPPYAVSITILKARSDAARREALVADLVQLANLLSNSGRGLGAASDLARPLRPPRATIGA